MLPVIALVGRPNVGKSTLFNRLTRSRNALVASFPGLTRDRQYGQGELGNVDYVVVDTGGLTDEKGSIDKPMADQVMQAIVEADVIAFMVDARDGRIAGDEAIAEMLRQQSRTGWGAEACVHGARHERRGAESSGEHVLGTNFGFSPASSETVDQI